MQRRQFIQMVRAGVLGSLTAGLAIASDRNQSPAYSQNRPPSNAQNTGALSVQWLGHMSFLFNSSGARILTHPFKPVGCAANRSIPKEKVDLVLISSRLLDEGYVEVLPKDTKLLYQPGSYDLLKSNFQGIRMDHDRLGGRRFGTNVAWRWQQAGIRILHLGGAAAPLLDDQRILMGRPDVLIVPVGGGAKGYDAAEAQSVVNMLNPKIVIPTYYRGDKAAASCDIAKVDEFLALMSNTKINKLSGSNLQISSATLPSAMTIMVFG